MKVITYVKPEIDKSYIKQEHEIRADYSANEEFEHWSDICIRAMKNGKIVDYQVELAI